jgi:hypothetical protein
MSFEVVTFSLPRALSFGKQRFCLKVVSIRLRRTEAQWFANIHGGLQAYDKYAHPPESVADCAFSIGLRLALEPDLRF